MRVLCCLLFAGSQLWTLSALAASRPRVVDEIKHDVSPPLREMGFALLAVQGPQFEKPERRAPKGFFHQAPGADPVVQDEYLPPVSITSLLSFDAITGTEGGAIPPDTNGSVGDTQFVEITNAVYEVFDKPTGRLLLGPVPINAIWKGFGGLCEQGGHPVDPVVLWDKLAQRWFVSQLGYTNFTHAALCIAVSTSDDATGRYNRYAYSTGGDFPDYPKYAVWPDAYCGTNNLLGISYLGAEPCAFDRAAMLAGKKAIAICMTPNPNNYGFLPSDLDGTTLPPQGAPNHYVELGNLTNQLAEYDFHVDFAYPKKSTFKGPHKISVPAYTLLCNDGANAACVPQPKPGEKLDSLSGLLMFRMAYRNFGDHESMLIPHSVAPGKSSTATAATRWYELRATPPGSKFRLYQAGTFQNKTDNLWMPSMAMDKQGNIAMGVSADNSSTLDTSIWLTGRVPTDPLGKLEAPVVVVKGSAVQVSHNWGDYSSMSIDPSDDCTFWYAQEYYNKKNGGPQSRDWTTHLVSFKFAGCE